MSSFVMTRLELHQKLFWHSYTLSCKSLHNQPGQTGSPGRSLTSVTGDCTAPRLPASVVRCRAWHHTCHWKPRPPLSIHLCHFPNGRAHHQNILHQKNGHILKTPKFSFIKKEIKYQWNLHFFKENKGLHKAGAKRYVANTWPLHRFLYCNTFCSWCNVQLQALHTTERNVLGSFCQ